MARRSLLIARLLLAGLLIGGALSTHPVRAQSLHFDVEIRLSNGPVAGSQLQVRFFGDNALLINGQPAVDHATGYGIWPANFADLPGGPYSTDDPGFQAFPGTLLAGERIFYRPLGAALYWSAASRAWTTAPAGTQIRIEGTVPAEIAIAWLVFNDPSAQAQYEYYSTPTLIAGDGITGPATKMVDEAASNGSFHTHLNWFIEGNRPTGAYLVQMQLFEPNGRYGASSPFYVLFNHGLGTSDYESAFLSRIEGPAQSKLVSVLQAIRTQHPDILNAIAASGSVSAVPEPRTAAMMLCALAVLAAAARRRHGRDQKLARSPISMERPGSGE